MSTAKHVHMHAIDMLPSCHSPVKSSIEAAPIRLLHVHGRMGTVYKRLTYALDIFLFQQIESPTVLPLGRLHHT